MMMDCWSTSRRHCWNLKYKKLIEDSIVRIDELNDICLEKANRFDLVEKDKDLLEES